MNHEPKTPIPLPPDLVTTAQAVEIIRRNTGRRLTMRRIQALAVQHTNGLPYMRVGRHMLFPRKSVDAWRPMEPGKKK